MNLIKVDGSTYEIDENLQWKIAKGDGKLLGVIQNLAKTIDIGPHSAPTPAGYVAFRVAKDLHGEILMQDENTSSGKVH